MYNQKTVDNKGISVIVCCYNSAERLPKTIEHLAKQHVPKNIPWEVVIVDNASTDDTAKIAEEEWNKHLLDVSFAIVYQFKAGLSYARRKGIEVAKYSYCLFCDDDNWLDKNYVSTAYHEINDDPSVGVVGGYGTAVFETPPPAWFEKVKHSYAVGPQASQAGDVTKERGYVFGAGAIFRKSVLLDLLSSKSGFFLTDRKGESITSGGDKELCLNYVLRGYRVRYTDQLRFKHYITKNRLTKQYYAKLEYSFVQSRTILSLYEYKLKGKEYILKRRFLWLRDLAHSFKNDFLARHPRSVNIFRSYTLALLQNYNSYHKTLKYLNKLIQPTSTGQYKQKG